MSDPIRDRDDNVSGTSFSFRLTEHPDTATGNLGPVWIVEEAAKHLRGQGKKGAPTQLCLYKIEQRHVTSVGQVALTKDVRRADVVMSMLSRARARSGVVVCSHRAVPVTQLAEKLKTHTQLDYVLEVDATRTLQFARARDNVRLVAPKARARGASWTSVKLPSLLAGSSACFATNLGKATLGEVADLTCFALSIGKIASYQRGELVGVTSLPLTCGLRNLVQLLAWTRWIRVAVRRNVRNAQLPSSTVGAHSMEAKGEQDPFELQIRANRTLASKHDMKEAEKRAQLPENAPSLRGRLTSEKSTLNIVELFAGAGGMGLGFLNARGSNNRGYRIVGSAEIHPIYTQTLRQNHAYMERAGLTPSDTTPLECIPMDLCSRATQLRLSAMAQERGDVDIVIGGPPCQGFSSANRNSWSSSNPNNRLVDAFIDCVTRLKPKLLLMENVQGILWTPRDTAGPSVATHVLERLGAMGYLVFPKLLDAAWYGVPQNRSRFFLLGIHKELGYTADDFGQWGPFPQPTHGPGTDKAFVTVRDAIKDLPRLANGDDRNERTYSGQPAQMNDFVQSMRTGTPADVIWDHITSRHADYVIERYKNIPQGKNWEAVRELMTNYADVDRTHSNIYRRLAWGEPAITMGHYRKSMIIHPSQHRGLSLREAARLQSFPDWFRFAGSMDGSHEGGLIHKQQQLANAVCPSVTRAVAEFLLNL